MQETRPPREAVEALERKLRSRIEDPDYWRSLNPDLTITENPFSNPASPYPISNDEMAACVQHIQEEGYFQTSPVLPEEDTEKLTRCIRNVVDRGHDAGYAFVYDEFYQVMARLTNILSPVLGDGYQLVPDEFGAYYIPTEDSAADTKPHRDSLRTHTSVRRDGRPTLVNVWIPLTDATTLNSCIYAVPAHRDPNYSQATGHGWGLYDVPLEDIRALPAKAGSIVCWNTSLLHWGGRSSHRATHPRISMATYYQSRDVPPYHKVTMDIPSPIPFAYRVYLIEKVTDPGDPPRME